MIPINKKIKDLFDIEKGELQSTKYKEGAYTFITAANEWKTHNSYTHNTAALVIAVAASGSLGRVHYIDGKFIASDLCFILTPKKEYQDQINLKFYFYFFKAIREDLVRKLAKGASKKAINKSDFGNFHIPFIDIKGQLEIAGEVEQIKSITAKLKEKVSIVSSQLYDARRLIIESTLQNQSWSNKISDFLEKNKETITVENQKTYRRVTIRMHAKGVLQRDELVGSKIGTKRQFVVHEGQLLISKIDARNDAFGIVPAECEGAITTSDFLSYNINQELIVSSYLHELLKTPYFKEMFKNSSKGATNRKRFQEKIFLDESIFLPSIQEQKKIVRKIAVIHSLSHAVFALEKNSEELEARCLLSVIHKLKEFEIKETKAIPVLSPIQPATPKVFDIQQAIAQILKRFQRGEMVVAKVLYIGQAVFGIPTNIQFSAQNFGPYDSAVKRAVMAGLSPQNQFFAKKGYGTNQVLTLGANANKVLQYASSGLATKTNAYLDEMMPYFYQYDSASIERLATICKIIEDERTADERVARTKLQEWKPNRFSNDDISRTLAFIKKHEWDKRLIK